MANQVELNANANMVIKLLNSVPIEVDYKHDIFIRETKNFQQYVTTSMKATKYIAGKKLNPAYDKLLKAKMQITPTQIKLDIINNKGEEKLKELEESYIDNRTKLALSANDDLDNSLINALSDSFMFFFSGDKKSYISILSNKDIYPKCLKKIDRTLCLVYTEDYNNLVKTTIKEYNKTNKTVSEASKGFQAKKLREKLTRTLAKEYTVPNLDRLLDTIARVSICYCIGTTDYENIDQAALNTALKIKSSKKSSKDKTLPLFIRKMISMVCYSLLNLGNTASIKTTGKQVDTNTGVTLQIMQDLHSRCEILGYPFFIKENKVFQFDKWSISPEEMLRRRSYIAPKMPFTYAGIKEGYLGYMISQLQSQVVYDQFLDGFGGSGASSVQFRHNKDAKYFINDFNFCIVSFYRVMLADKSVYDEFIYKLDYLWKLYIEAYELAVDYLHQIKAQGKTQKEANKIAGDEFYFFSDTFYDTFSLMSDFSWNVTERNNALSTPMKDFKIELDGNKNSKDKSKIRPYAGKIVSIKDGVLSVKGSTYEFPDKIKEYAQKKISYIDAAVLFTYYVMHPVTGAIEKNIFTDKIIYKSNYNTIDELKKKFTSFRSAFKSKIVNNNGSDTMFLLKNIQFNNNSTLAYLDSPYIGTVGYSVTNIGNNTVPPKKYTLENIGVEGYFNEFNMTDLIDSCKAYKGYYIFSCRENMVKGDIGKLADRFKNFGNVVKETTLLNNYIWFWRQWKATSNQVLFMYDLDYSPKSSHPFVEELINNNINSLWGTNLDEDLKNNIIYYLFSCAFNGKDLEIMITNFNYEDISFGNMYEYLDNIHNKATDAITTIPEVDKGMFVSMPVSIMAEVVLSAMQVFINRL